ncbi:alkaline phosphatase family protein [Cellulomonas composti]|uniref:Phosphodiesterase n=1 Tax=Cellulomonas composti TaxID=266130 RepID=A0A511J8H7_9CELL|nr:alkaline phosphatase family protein [Cellulomonas composti]GEL94292.1 hypothetical protein CCO02nite_09500 [Cellulomonas composti]
MSDRLTWLPAGGDVADAAISLVTTAVGVGVAIAILPGVSTTDVGGVLVVALLVFVGDLLLRAPMRALARVAGAVGALTFGLAVQVAITWVALEVVPGITVASGWAAFGVLVIAGIVMAAGRWVWGANDSDYVVADLLRRARRKARRRARAGGEAAGGAGDGSPGMLVVQLDGVAEPVLREAIEAGLAPTMQRWLEDGSHRLETWWARVPSTTPASQAGLLHGDSGQIPAFRWWDRDLRRLVVTNHPADAALVEDRLSNGKGLLAGGGTAVSTMFTGDAAGAFLVMSRTRTRGPDGQGGGLGPGPAFVRFFASPFVLTRAVALTFGEMLKELYQARRQRVRNVLPRVSRGGWYVVLRGVTNVLQRDLATSLVAEALLRGDPTIYVDLVDYDEIAHHAGPTRPESLRALEGLDRVLRTLTEVVAAAPREYRIVVLSDHGQALGSTYEQLTGVSLLDTVRALIADQEPQASGVSSSDGEDWGPLNTLLTSVVGSQRGPVLGPDGNRGGRQGSDESAAGELPDVVTVGSGNLGLVWFPRSPQRLVLEDLQERWPRLVTGLLAQPGVGVLVVDTRERGLVAVGRSGVVLLEPPEGVSPEDTVDGEDPLVPYGPRGRMDLARAGRLPHTGDLLLISTVSELGRIHAFEGQVGSHGGIGGAQNLALLLHPQEWAVDEDLRTPVGDRDLLVGAEAVHHQLVRWAAAAGLRP